MSKKLILELEKLIKGDRNMISIDTIDTISIEMLIGYVGGLISKNDPDTECHGEFLDHEKYLIYDLHITPSKTCSCSSIRFVHSGDVFQVLRV